MLCLDKRDNIINIAYLESELTEDDKVLLGLATKVEVVEAIEEVEEVEEVVVKEAEIVVEVVEIPTITEVQKPTTPMIKRRR